jgi:hypothetical protein
MPARIAMQLRGKRQINGVTHGQRQQAQRAKVDEFFVIDKSHTFLRESCRRVLPKLLNLSTLPGRIAWFPAAQFSVLHVLISRRNIGVQS